MNNVVSSGMLRPVALVKTDISEKRSLATDAPYVLRLLVTADVVPSSPILVTRMMEALRSSETSLLTRATRRNIPEDGILHSHSRENLKSYNVLSSFVTSMMTSISYNSYYPIRALIFSSSTNIVFISNIL
jgi:hypothetical protein